eukprot:TRINITY_DN4387_c2_g2_i1.p1 TRINITY_DN4387_c2_g2~~TRINITY_DN4387_c2_g2_i1.p1  ORF type:complete len:752 (-),score=154.69 TRINITY_DN4387_c2_g2_i1:101-2170(-)
MYDIILKKVEKYPSFIRYEEENSLQDQWMRSSVTQKWTKGQITNFEYLTILNMLAGRTFNDLHQYPVFPFVLSDYKSEELDLNDEKTFRDLSLPMGALNPDRFTAHFERKYNESVEMGMTGFFYGTHYSNLGVVLYFLIRLEPFSRYALEFQSGKFDLPDRLFYSVEQSWMLSSNDSSSDVKELIPEFFYLPHFFDNTNGFRLGTKQNGIVVNNVVLPPWAKNDPHVFIRKHIEALESDYVSKNLHHWIDLIFGCKQNGEAALAAKNLFHPRTYEGQVDLDKITDKREKQAEIDKINEFGQTPRQLFNKKHPSRNISDLPTRKTVASHPELLKSVKLSNLSSYVASINFVNNDIIPLNINQTIFWERPTAKSSEKHTNKFMEWGRWDGSLALMNLKDHLPIFNIESIDLMMDTIVCVDVSKDGSIIACGCKSSFVRLIKKHNRILKDGEITVPNMMDNKKPSVSNIKLRNSTSTEYICTPEKKSHLSAFSSPGGLKLNSSLQLPNSSRRVTEIEFVASLDGHDDEVRCVRASSEWSIVVSGSADGTCIIWDTYRARMIRSLNAHNGPIVAVDIMTYSGDIVVVDDKGDDDGTIHLWTINGAKLASTEFRPKALCVAVSKVKPGLGPNIICTGHTNGEIMVWNATDLTFRCVLRDSRARFPITALAIRDDNQMIVSGDASGLIVKHEMNL